MEPLHIERTKSTPEIHYDVATGVLNISGESYPENSFEFYRPLLAWVEKSVAIYERMVIAIDLHYLNTGSTKCILDLLDRLEESFLNGKSIEIRWHCDRENERAVEAAEEFKEEVTLPFQIVFSD